MSHDPILLARRIERIEQQLERENLDARLDHVERKVVEAELAGGEDRARALLAQMAATILGGQLATTSMEHDARAAVATARAILAEIDKEPA